MSSRPGWEFAANDVAPRPEAHFPQSRSQHLRNFPHLHNTPITTTSAATAISSATSTAGVLPINYLVFPTPPTRRAVPQLDDKPAHPAMLVVPVPNADPGPPLQEVPRVEAAAGNPVGGGEEGDGRWKDRWKVRDLLADGRCSRAVLDFLSSTDMGRRAPAEAEGDAVSAVSELEVREWLEEQGREEDDNDDATPDMRKTSTEMPRRA